MIENKRNEPEADIEERAVILLQSFYDKTMTEEEACELLDIWADSSRIEEEAKNSFLAESAFRFVNDSRLHLSSDRLEQLRKAFKNRMEISPDHITATFLDMDELARLAAELPSLPRTGIVEEIPSSLRKPITPFDRNTGRSWIPLKILAPVLLLLFGMAVYLEFWPASSYSGEDFIALAEITESIDAVWKNDDVYKKGRHLGLEKLNLLEGVVQIRLKNNVEIALEGPTEFVLRGDDETFCRAGKISVTVPPEGKGFKIATPVATVIDLGTEFSLSVDDEKIDVHVVKGMVDVARSSSDRLQLTTGLAAMLDFKGVIRQYEADLSNFFSRDIVRKIWNDYMQRRRTVWEEEERRRLEDPSLLVSLADVRVLGCREVEGSRPDRTAFRFQSQRDCLDVSMPGEHVDLTLVANVRIRNGTNYTNTLCIGFDFFRENGEFFWQASNNGVLRFHLRGKGLECYDSGIVFSRKDWNTWMQLAVVADGRNKEIRHYVDGRLVATLPWTNPLPLKMPQGAIGNMATEQRTRTPKNWSGDIDAFYAFFRSLPDEEIKEMYDNNR